ncbi:precorrin-3B synthase [Methylobacterium durans]|uniref:precorrin-3B synthase n=1 Tax=Methylobacterium durans TaxID=2202825 RepID=UPI002AFFBAE0|nr:precorrin-3B synthase [Methylobacterium durans]MEA1834142.1 precorrin-3B synthase [Methylobacterium durans]
MSVARRVLPALPSRRGWCPGLARPMPTGDGLLARIHPAGGVLSLAQAKSLAEAARRFGNGHIDVTARANLQVRGVTEETRGPLAAFLDAAGLGDARHDGGPQRLTLASPLAGLDPAERIDVPALARAIEAAGLAIPGLPAKTLVSLHGGGRFGPGEAEADIVAHAVGVGKVALALATAEGPDWIGEVTEAEAAGTVAALLNAFARTGRRRVRDLSDAERRTLPATRSTSPVRERSSPRHADRVRGATSPDTSHPSPQPSPERERGSAAPAGLLTLSTSLTVLAVEAPFGRCDADALDALARIAGALGAPEIRLSSTRGFVLVATDPAAAGAALADLAAAGFVVAPEDPRRAVAACPGAPACASGSTPTLRDAARLAEAFRPFARRGLTAHVSGCAKGCARPAPADLTLVGHDGRYGIVLDGGPGDEPATQLTFEAALERVRRADSTETLHRAFDTRPIKSDP